MKTDKVHRGMSQLCTRSDKLIHMCICFWFSDCFDAVIPFVFFGNRRMCLFMRVAHSCSKCHLSVWHIKGLWELIRVTDAGFTLPPLDCHVCAMTGSECAAWGQRWRAVGMSLFQSNANLCSCSIWCSRVFLQLGELLTLKNKHSYTLFQEFTMSFPQHLKWFIVLDSILWCKWHF